MILIIMVSIHYSFVMLFVNCLMEIFTQSNLRTSTGEAITVEVSNTSGQRASQHLQLLPTDHITRQVLLGERGMMGLGIL